MELLYDHFQGNVNQEALVFYHRDISQTEQYLLYHVAHQHQNILHILLLYNVLRIQIQFPVQLIVLYFYSDGAQLYLSQTELIVASYYHENHHLREQYSCSLHQVLFE